TARAGDEVAFALDRRARTRLEEVRRRAERRLPPPLRAATGGRVPCRRGRRRRARARAARRVRGAATLGRVRARRNTCRPGDRADPMGLPALRRRGLALAGTPRG